ncbi:MAG: hypothetical protein R3D67_00960 [Hyphomicrobiaceae bacterium]
MADIEQNTPETGDQGNAVPRSEELDAILQRIAKHIADVERKQGAADAEHGDDAPATPPANAAAPDRPSIRKHASHKLAQPSDAAAQMQQAIPGTSHPRPAGQSAHLSSSLPDPEGHMADGTEFGPPNHRPVPSSGRTVEPLPLKSNLTDPRLAQTEQPKPAPQPQAQATPEPGPSPMHEPTRVGAHAPAPTDAPAAGNADTDAMAWRPEEAEAVTQMYEAASGAQSEGHDAGLTPSELPMMPLMTAAPIPAPVSADAKAPAADFSSHQLDALSRRIEAAFDKFAPMAAVEGLGNRFQSLEARIVSALDTLADRADSPAPDNLADQIAALTNQVNQAESKLARLDDMQASLDALTGKLNDDHVVQLFGSLVPTAEELTQFAEDAAGRAAERALEGQARLIGERGDDARPHDSVPGASQEIQTLTAALADFMDDRRRNDDGISEALETLQLAMRHMLDRMDQIEAGAPALADVQPQARQPAQDQARHPDSERLGMVASNLAAHAPRDLDETPIEASHHVDFEPATQSPSRPVANERHHEPAFADELHDEGAAGKFRDLRPGQPSAPDEMHELAAEAAAPPPPMSDRRAFIEQARRAAERASAEAAASANAPKQSRAKPAAEVPGPVAAGAMSAMKPQIRPGIMLVALLAVVLLAGYWILGGPRSNLIGNIRNMMGDAAPATSAPQATPAVVSAPSGQAPDIAPPPQSTGAIAPPAESEKSSKVLPAAADEPGPTLANAIMQGGPEISGPTGVSLAMGAQPTSLERMMRAREQSRLARLSQRTALNAEKLLGSSPAPAMPAGVDPAIAKRITVSSATHAPAPAPSRAAVPTPVPANSKPVVTGSVSPAPAAAHVPQTLELPPASIGPTSLRVAAAKGDPSAQLEIASRFAEGKGVRRDLAAASDWYQRAAGQGNAVAQYRLAAQFERGIGVARDPVQARLWYERAAAQGNVKAMHNLAVTLASSNGGAPDYAKAAKWFAAAAEHGLADSQYNLAILLESGYGVAKDPVAALKWYMLAAKRGDTDSANRRDQLIARLPQSGVQAANAAVNGWRPKPTNRVANDAKASADAWKRRQTAAR